MFGSELVNYLFSSLKSTLNRLLSVVLLPLKLKAEKLLTSLYIPFNMNLKFFFLFLGVVSNHRFSCCVVTTPYLSLYLFMFNIFWILQCSIIA
jgi:hypothetical protein